MLYIRGRRLYSDVAVSQNRHYRYGTLPPLAEAFAIYCGSGLERARKNLPSGTDAL